MKVLAIIFVVLSGLGIFGLYKWRRRRIVRGLAIEITKELFKVVYFNPECFSEAEIKQLFNEVVDYLVETKPDLLNVKSILTCWDERMCDELSKRGFPKNAPLCKGLDKEDTCICFAYDDLNSAHFFLNFWDEGTSIVTKRIVGNPLPIRVRLYWGNAYIKNKREVI